MLLSYIRTHRANTVEHSNIHVCTKSKHMYIYVHLHIHNIVLPTTIHAFVYPFIHVQYTLHSQLRGLGQHFEGGPHANYL